MIFSRPSISLRSRIFASFLLALLPVLVFFIAAIEMLLVPAISADVRQDLANSTHLLKKSIQTGTTVAVRNHLKAIAEKNAEIVAYHIDQVVQGLLSREDAVKRQGYSTQSADRHFRLYLLYRFSGNGRHSSQYRSGAYR